ncbi:LAMI_0H03774g1_1 [Lachancea mirantina]|uniref:LAMI_0H03774g1_1 n=1 Tax=Lachancea mirantina TaxID=1230905 RepID=A0A1G4KEU6_9SACH|nr:LAMI_0H03774g1_1 [Lachancea mirantina]
MSKQRVISESTGLYKLSIVNKQQSERDQDSKDEGIEKTREDLQKKGLPLSVPVRTRPVPAVPSGTRDGLPTSKPKTEHSQFSEDLLFQLASKRRHVVELKEQLAKAERELGVLEQKCIDMSVIDRGGDRPEKLQDFSHKIHQTFKDVNSSPGVIKSKQSISNFFNKDVPLKEITPTRSPTRSESPQPSSISPTRSSNLLQMTSSKFRDLKNGHTQSPFLNRLMNKWQDFNVNDAEEEEFDSTRNTDQFYIKSKPDYDDDEEIETESDMDLGDSVVMSTFRR